MFDDLIDHGNIQSAQFDYYDMTDVNEYNMLDLRREFSFSIFNFTTKKTVEIDPKAGYFVFELQDVEHTKSREIIKSTSPLTIELCNNT